MKTLLLWCVLIGAVACASAQETAPAPATKQDFQDLRKEVIEAKQAAERAAEGQKDAARAAEKQSNGIKDAVSENSGAQKQSATELKAAIDQQKKLIAAEQAKNRQMVLTLQLLFAGIVALVGGSWLFAFFARKGKNERTAITEDTFNTEFRQRAPRAIKVLHGETRQLMTPPAEMILDKLRDDASPAEINAFGDLHKEIASFGSTVRLQSGALVEGTVFKDALGVRVIQFPGQKPIALENRRRAAQNSFNTSGL